MYSKYTLTPSATLDVRDNGYSPAGYSRVAQSNAAYSPMGANRMNVATQHPGYGSSPVAQTPVMPYTSAPTPQQAMSFTKAPQTQQRSMFNFTFKNIQLPAFMNPSRQQMGLNYGQQPQQPAAPVVHQVPNQPDDVYSFDQYMTDKPKGSDNGYGYETPAYPPKPPTPEYPPHRPPVVIAEHQKAGIWGDPHVLNPDDKAAIANGTRTFDSYDVGSFNILSDKGIKLDADFIQRRGTVTEVGDVRFQIGNAELTIEDKYNVRLNGKALTHDGVYQIDEHNKVIKTGKKYDVQSPEYNITFDVIDGFDNNTFLGMWIHTGAQGVYADGMMPTGMLGDFFDADNNIEQNWKQPLGAYRLNQSVANYIDRQPFGSPTRFF